MIRPIARAVGDAGSDWISAQLRDVATFSSGTTPSRALHSRYFANGRNRWVKTLDLNNSLVRSTDECVTNQALAETSLRTFPRGTVLVAMYGGFQQIGRTGLLEVPASVNQAITAITVDPRKVVPHYLLFLLNYRVGHWRSVASSSRKDPNITSADVKAFPVLLPSVVEQHRIVDVLSAAEQLEQALEAVIAKKQAIKQGMMQQLLTGATRLPGFSEQWQRLRIQDVLAPRTERNALRESLDVLSCTKHRGFVRSLDFFKNQVFSRDLSNYLLIHWGDIGYPANHVEEGSIGVQEVVDRGLVSPIYVVMSPLDGHDTYFLQRQLKLEFFKQEFARVTNASVNRRGSLRWKEFSQIRVLVPSKSEQHAISSVLRGAESEIAALQARLTKAKAIKLGMMQELLTGRTRLPAEVSS